MPMNYGGGSSSPFQAQRGGGGFDVQSIFDKYTSQTDRYENLLSQYESGGGRGGGGGFDFGSAFGGGARGRGSQGGGMLGAFGLGGGGNATAPDWWRPAGERGPMPQYAGGSWGDYQNQIVNWWRGGGGGGGALPPGPGPTPGPGPGPRPGPRPGPGPTTPPVPRPPTQPALGAAGGGVGGMGREAPLPRAGEPWDAYLGRLSGYR